MNRPHDDAQAHHGAEMKKAASLALAGALLLPTLASAEISTPRQIADRPAAHCQAPRWSPDGLQVAFDVYNPKVDTREIWIAQFSSDMRKDGESEVTTGRSAAGAALGGKKPPVVELAWAPDMKAANKPYVFSSPGAKKNFDLFIDGTWLTNNPGNDGQPDWSSDGRYIAYASQRKDSGDIYVIDLQGDPEKPLQATRWPDATEFRPRWAPKKNYLLFTRSLSGNKGQDIGLVIDVTRAADTTQMITDWTGDEIRPSWSPDARRVAFYSNKGQQNDKIFDLWVIDINGQNATKLATDVVVDDHFGPQWTPDGQTILFVQRDFKRDNPVMWTRQDGSAKGVLDTGTQLNGDLALRQNGEQLILAFKALGQRGSTNKTWERLYVVTFSAADLVAPAQ